MKICLINPPRFKNKMPVGREDRCENTIPNVIPPTGLVYMGTLLKNQGHAVHLIDANGFQYTYSQIQDFFARNIFDMIIFRATPETFFHDIRVAQIVKKIRNSTLTVLICWSLTTVPRDVLRQSEDIDVYITDFYYERPVLTLSETLIPDNINGIAYRNENSIIINESEKNPFNFDSVSKPYWDFLPDFDNYWIQVPSIRPWTFITSAKGCGLNCRFCTISKIKPSFRNVKNVGDEIEYLYKARGIRYLSFFDSTFNFDQTRAFQICQEIVDRDLTDLKWFANVRANISQELSREMKNAGCDGVSIGIESGSQRVLDLSNKKITVQEAADTVKNLQELGIKQYASFILGLPGETQESMKETNDFILKLKPTAFQVNSFVPYPRSEIYIQAVKEGKINELKFDELLLYNAPVSFCDLSIEEINAFRKKIYHNVYFSPGWWISNMRHIMRNPSDLNAGCDYALKALKRLVHGVEFEN